MSAVYSQLRPYQRTICDALVTVMVGIPLDRRGRLQSFAEWMTLTKPDFELITEGKLTADDIRARQVQVVAAVMEILEEFDCHPNASLPGHC